MAQKAAAGVQQLLSDPPPEEMDVPGAAISLVHLDKDDNLQLNASAVQTCFMAHEISRYPVCLICVIGERRLGKSFLLNYILRGLQSQEKGETFSLGSEDQPLEGFEWKAGTDSITKGILIWNRPVILEHNGEKLAVYLLDSEGSLDFESDRNISIKMSVLSMMISSHLIFNVTMNLNETELDNLEMYLEIGEDCETQYLQCLDILIRDWYDSANCSSKVGQDYIVKMIQKLKKRKNNNNYPKVLKHLNSCQCHLLPYPGKYISQGGQGRLKDMEEEFQACLNNYVSEIVKGVWKHVKTNDRGALTCAQIPAMLKEVMNNLPPTKYNIRSPLEMCLTIKNRKRMNTIEVEFSHFLGSQNSFRPPPMMKSHVSKKMSELIEEFGKSLSDSYTEHHDKLRKELHSHLREEEETFFRNYTRKFTGSVALGSLSVIGTGITVMSLPAAGTKLLPVMKAGATMLATKVFRPGL